MGIIELQERENISDDVELSKQYAQMQEFLSELRERNLPEKVISIANQKIHEINTYAYDNKMLRKVIRIKQKDILHYIVQETNIVPKKFYKYRWASFGVPMSIPFSAFTLAFFNDYIGNGFLSTVLVNAFFVIISASIGAYFGARKDKKAFSEGRQLKANVSY